MNRWFACFWRFCLVLLMAGQAVGALAVEEFHVCRFCANGACSNMAAGGDGDAGRKYAPARYVDMLNIKLDVTPDFKRQTVTGTATLDFAPIGKPLTEFRLDAVHLEVSDLRSSVPVANYSSTTDELVITFARPLNVGEKCTLAIDYSAEPRQGIYFRTPEQGYPAEDTHLFTQGEPQRASYWFPCHDYPNERSSTEMICHVPKGMTVLSNGVLVAESINADTGLKTVHWRQEKPHVAYLITLVAGNFTKLETTSRGVPLAFYSQPTIGKHSANSFKNTADIMDFFHDEIGVPYPWDKYYQVTVRDFQFGGMENTSMTTLAHRSMHTAESENIHSGWVRTLDAHEMVHQWFGDYVTCKDWSHLWLNEGFATYYSYLYEAYRFGHDDLLYKMYRDATRRVLSQSDDRRPIVYNQYKKPFEQFDFRAYPKGSWVLHMLRSQLGKDLYRECVKTYLERNALTSVTTADFSKVVEEVSGQSFDRFFDQWVYHARFPSLKVRYKWLEAEKLAKVTVEQTQTTDKDVLLFEFPTKLRFTIDEQQIDHAIEVNKTKQEYYVPLSAEPEQVRFDPEYSVLAEVDFKKTDKMLQAQLDTESDLIGRILAIHQLADRKTTAAIESIGQKLLEDSFYGVRLQAAKALKKIGSKAALEQLAKATLVKDARVRVSVIEMIGGFDSERARELLVKHLQQERNPAIVAEAVRGLGKYRHAEVEKIVTAMLESDSFRNELAEAALDAVGKKEDTQDYQTVLRVLNDRGEELSSRGLGNGLKTLANLSRGLQAESTARGEVERYLRKYVEHTKQPVQLAAIAALGNLGEGRSVDLLEALADDTSGDGVGQAAVDALKKLRSKKPAVPKELGDLRKQLNELKEQSEELQQEVDQLKAEKKG